MRKLSGLKSKSSSAQTLTFNTGVSIITHGIKACGNGFIFLTITLRNTVSLLDETKEKLRRAKEKTMI